MTSPTDEPIVYLATAPNEPMASLWIDVLADEGIRAMAKALGPGAGAWGSSWTFEHNLYVLASQLPAAQAVIAELEPEHTSGEFVRASGDLTPCPPAPTGTGGHCR